MSGLGSIGSYVRNRNCDTVIQVNGSIFGAHKVVLQEHSPFFKKTIARHGNQENIIIDDVDMQGMEWCIHFMYTGDCPPNLYSTKLDLGEVDGAIQAADILQMEQFKTKCLDLIQCCLTPENCFEAIEIFRKYCESRAREAQTFVIASLKTMLNNKDFLSVSSDDFFEYISESEENLEVKWKAITSWIEHEPLRRLHLYKALNILLDSRKEVLPILLLVIEYGLLNEPACIDRIYREVEKRETKWTQNMTVNSSVQLLKLVTSNHFPNQGVAERLKRAITEYLICHFDEAKDRYCGLGFEEFKMVISSLKSKSEVQWEYIVSWIEHDDARNNHLLTLIKLVDVDALTPNFISNHMRKMITSSNECLNYILDHLLNVTSIKQCKITNSLVVYDSKTQILTLLDTSTNAYAVVTAPPTKSVSRITSIAGELFLHCENILYKLTLDGTWLKLSDIPDYSQFWTQFIAHKSQLFIISSKAIFQYTLNNKAMKCHDGCSLGNGFAATCSDACIYAVGGSHTHNRAKQYTSTNGWADLPTMPIFASTPAATYFKSKLYVMGGTYAGSSSNSVTYFDDTTWVIMRSMLRRRSQFAAMAYKGKILVIGGSSGLIMPYEDVEEYSDETNSWKQIGLIHATKGVVSIGVCEVDKTSVSFKNPERGSPPTLFVAGRITSNTTFQ